MNILYPLASVVLVSLVSFIGVVTLSMRKHFLQKILLMLVSLSAGTLLGGAFFHLLPEASYNGFSIWVSLYVMLGIFVFFVVERVIHWKHNCLAEDEHHHGILHPPHKHHIGWMNVLGDGIHNLIDGLVIVGAYFVSVPVGMATTVAVILHEIPQEFADFGVLLYSGFSKRKAVLLNLVSALFAVLGAGIGLIFGVSDAFVGAILPFAAGGFIYIAGVNLIPELHHECDAKQSIIHGLMFLFGILIMLGLLVLD